MGKDVQYIVFSVLLLLLAIGGFYLVNRRAKQIASLKEKYQEALSKGDKQSALILGRQYYRLRRGGNLSTYDEAAITNDLSVIDSQLQP